MCFMHVRLFSYVLSSGRANSCFKESLSLYIRQHNTGKHWLTFVYKGNRECYPDPIRWSRCCCAADMIFACHTCHRWHRPVAWTRRHPGEWRRGEVVKREYLGQLDRVPMPYIDNTSRIQANKKVPSLSPKPCPVHFCLTLPQVSSGSDCSIVREYIF